VVVDVSSDVAQTGAQGAELVYTGLDANLTPGTWLVQGVATLTSLGNTDAQQLVLYNETTGNEVSNSKGMTVQRRAMARVQKFTSLAGPQVPQKSSARWPAKAPG